MNISVQSNLNTTPLISKELQLLVWGDRNTFVFDHSSDINDKISTTELAHFLHTLDKLGYAISNAHVMTSWSSESLQEFKSQLFALIDDTTKTGFVFRKTFAQSEKITSYTNEEWLSIAAQYSVTYQWSHEFRQCFGVSAQNVLADYVGSIDRNPVEINNTNKKVFSLSTVEDLAHIVRAIVESKAVLRAQQLKTLDACPSVIVAKVCSDAKITLKETLIKVMKLTVGIAMEKPLLKTSTDILRFVVSAFAHVAVEGQLTKAVLKTTKIRLPSSIRRSLLNNLELIALNKKSPLVGTQYLAEDMFVFEMFWRRLDKYLRYESSAKTRKKYPLYTAAIDLLYKGDRHWTFNGRYSIAKANLDYAQAIKVASERPGFLLRNLVEFLRMTKGRKTPVKAVSSKTRHNPFQNMLSGNGKKKPMLVKTDASNFFLNGDFAQVLGAHINPKLAWQLLETLNDRSLNKSISTREVQGQLIHYSTAIPPINKKLTRAVRDIILDSLRSTLHRKNKDIRLLYIDSDSEHYKLQYSGRSSTEISFAGDFLSPGSELVMSDVISARGIDNPILRLGVIWRSLENNKQSVDLDHNVTLNTGENIYYGSPEYKMGKTLLAASSGDITSCGDHKSKFSIEFVDLNIGDLYSAGIKSFYNSVINYNGRGNVSLGSLETYFIFSFVDKSLRKIDGSMINIDLSKSDYAIRIDPDNTDKSGSYIGIQFDMEKDRIKALCIPVKNSHGGYSNVHTNKKRFDDALLNISDQLTIHYALNQSLSSTQITDNISCASVVISRKSREELGLEETATLLHPGRNMEEISQMLF